MLTLIITALKDGRYTVNVKGEPLTPGHSWPNELAANAYACGFGVGRTGSHDGTGFTIEREAL